MRFLRIIVLVTCLGLVAGCSCRTKKVAGADENVSYAQRGNELADINFAFDSYALSDTAKQILGTSAAWLKNNAGAKVQVEGHCDERGTNEYNMALGAKRARAAADYLRSLGVEGQRLSTVSYGEELPLDPRHNEEAWAKNRRAHFNVQK